MSDTILLLSQIIVILSSCFLIWLSYKWGKSLKLFFFISLLTVYELAFFEITSIQLKSLLSLFIMLFLIIFSFFECFIISKNYKSERRLIMERDHAKYKIKRKPLK
ncbi:hypothetical protein C2804_11475 [Pasteurella multocida]|nr:hypothetical protein [Pasteurella multocida]NNI42883.1 hypothetical protein [Pasteurella multocida]